MGHWRDFYNYMGWDYWDTPLPRQKHLKYLCCQQIKKSNVIKIIKHKKLKKKSFKTLSFAEAVINAELNKKRKSH